MILSPTKICNIFPGSVEQNSILKIIPVSCLGDTIFYIPNNELWLTRLSMELPQRKNRTCLTIDCRQNIPNIPGKFR